MNHQNNTKMLLRRQVLERVGYSAAHLYRLMAKGLFPKQVHLGVRRVGWLENEIEAWLAEKIAARDAQPPVNGGNHGRVW